MRMGNRLARPPDRCAPLTAPARTQKYGALAVRPNVLSELI